MKKLTFLAFVFAVFTMSSLSFATDEGGETTTRLLVINAHTGDEVLRIGEDLDERISPFSTFKVFLSVVALDNGNLTSVTAPVFKYKESYRKSYLPDSHWQDTNPQMWLTNSVVWVSQQMTTEMGAATINRYLQALQYGNEDASGEGDKGITNFWLESSLKISVLEQVAFLRNLVLRELPVSVDSMNLTEQMLYHETLDNGYDFYGKTGGHKGCGWFIGWARKEGQCYVFAKNIFVHKNVAQDKDYANYPARRAKAYMKNFISERF